jgi:hypothetical protein
MQFSGQLHVTAALSYMEDSFGMLCAGEWMGPTKGLGALKNTKNCFPAENRFLELSAAA